MFDYSTDSSTEVFEYQFDQEEVERLDSLRNSGYSPLESVLAVYERRQPVPSSLPVVPVAKRGSTDGSSKCTTGETLNMCRRSDGTLVIYLCGCAHCVSPGGDAPRRLLRALERFNPCWQDKRAVLRKWLPYVYA